MKQKKKIILLVNFFVIFLLNKEVHAQNTIVLQPDTSGIDALISDYNPTLNFGTYPSSQSLIGTNSGTVSIYRSLMKFNLTSVPKGAIISKAKLYLTGINSLSGAQTNAIDYLKATSNWNENTVTWSTQPSTTTVGRYSLDPTTSAAQIDSTDITAFVQDWVTNPSTNFGFMLKLQTESTPVARRITASSDATLASSRPKLVITYNLTGIKATTPSSQVVAYPNPARGSLNIANITSKTSIKIYNAIGELLLDPKHPQKSL